MKFRVQVAIMLKKSVLDPQGAAVERALKLHGYEGIKAVRIGKLIELELEDKSGNEVKTKVTAWADQFLANPVLETFDVTVELQS